MCLPNLDLTPQMGKHITLIEITQSGSHKLSTENIYLQSKIKIQHTKINTSMIMWKSAIFMVRAIQTKEHLLSICLLQIWGDLRTSRSWGCSRCNCFQPLLLRKSYSFPFFQPRFPPMVFYIKAHMHRPAHVTFPLRTNYTWNLLFSILVIA